jgi:hypothetical protein
LRRKSDNRHDHELQVLAWNHKTVVAVAVESIREKHIDRIAFRRRRIAFSSRAGRAAQSLRSA